MPEIDAIAHAIDQDLETTAREVIRTHLDLSIPENANFLRDPDNRAQHQERWHQWGILTHTRRFLDLYDTVLPDLLRQWGLWTEISRVLESPIDGVPRGSLLRITILLHDIGKFGKRTIGPRGFHFAGHERLSGVVIREEMDLVQAGLTPDQAEYVALTAEDHFVLGLLRRKARESGEFVADFTASATFRQRVQAIRLEHPLDYVEIGVLFLGDSLAKANPGEGPEPALLQYDLNIDVARRYLQIVLDERQP